MKRFEHKLPRMTSPMRPSFFRKSGLPNYCGIRLTCQACGRDIKHDETRGIVGRMLVHLKAACIEEAGAAQVWLAHAETKT